MKVAIVGVGRQGRRHIDVVRSLDLELVGVSDQSVESLRAAGVENGLPEEKCYLDAGAMLEQTLPECVLVATTAPTHCQYVCMAAEEGVRYVLAEKPMAISLAECDRMIEACRSAGAALAVNHQMRFMEQYTEPKQIVYSDAFGGLSSVTVVGGNFGLAMNGTHYFEMFRYMTDESVAEVSAWFSPEVVANPRGPQYEDRAGAVRLTTASGKRMFMDVGADHGHGVRVVYGGSRGQLVVDELRGTMHLSVREDDSRDLPTTRYGSPSVDTVREIEPADNISPSRAVLEALLNGDGAPSGDDGRAAVAALVAAYESDERGNVAVPVDGRLPEDRVFPWA